MKNFSVKYAIIALMPLFVLAGCKKHEYKNVVMGMPVNATKKALLLKDVETGQERIWVGPEKTWNNQLDYLKVGDTVVIITGDVIFSRDEYYQKNLILYSGNVGLTYNTDSVHARQQRARFEQLKQNTIKTR